MSDRWEYFSMEELDMLLECLNIAWDGQSVPSDWNRKLERALASEIENEMNERSVPR